MKPPDIIVNSSLFITLQLLGPLSSPSAQSQDKRLWASRHWSKNCLGRTEERVGRRMNATRVESHKNEQSLLTSPLLKNPLPVDQGLPWKPQKFYQRRKKKIKIKSIAKHSWICLKEGRQEKETGTGSEQEPHHHRGTLKDHMGITLMLVTEPRETWGGQADKRHQKAPVHIRS